MDKLLAPGIFRLFLAYLVVLHHVSVISFGGWAVFAFFILSGYWITEVWRVKYSRMQQPYLQFIASRYLRLLPVYLACYFCSLLILKLTVADYTAHNATWWLKLVSIVFADVQAFFLPPMWSIVVEMRFYLMAPLFIWLALKVAKQGNPPVPPMLLAVFTAGLVVIILLSLKPLTHFSAPAVSKFLLYFVLGILINTTGYQPTRKIALISIATLFLAAALTFVSEFMKNVFGPESVRPTDGFWVLMSHLFSGGLAVLTVPYIAYSVRVRGDKLDRELGNLSYPLYLFHFCIVFLFNNVPQLDRLPFVQRVSLSLLLMTAGALVIYWLVDRPFEKWRKKSLSKSLQSVNT